jgi:hypothetical protein
MKARSGRNARGRWGVRRALALTIAAAVVPTGALALAPAASGATLYSNLSGGGADSSGTGEVVPPAQRIAQPFVATASGTARLVGFYGVSYLNQPSVVSIQLHSNNNGDPGPVIATGAPTVVDADSDAVPTCTALSGVGGAPLPALSVGQTYWAVFQAQSNPAFWSTASQGGGAPKRSSNSGASWATTTLAARSLLVDDGQSCQPDISTIPSPDPDPNAELGDMYAKPGGTSFQTLSASNNGVAELKLTGGSFSGPDASMFKLLNGEPEGKPPGSAFTFPKTLGSSAGGVILMYIVCAPPLGTDDGMYTATFTLTSNDPDEGSLTWPVWCLLDSTPPSLEFIQSPNGRNGWFVTNPAPLQIRGIDPESGNRVKRIFCTDNGEATLDWPNGSFASFLIQPEGIHALSCQGTDLANNTSAPGAFTTTVKIDTTPPETTKGDVGPPAVSDLTGFDFSFAGSDAMSGPPEFECQLDSGPYELCTSPASRGGLGNGTHTFDVRARDGAGNYDATPARWTWEVNAPAPRAADDTATATRGTPLDIDVLANDVAPRGEPLHVVLDGNGTGMGGAISVAGSKVHYVPSKSFAGTDSFRYWAVNGNGVKSEATTVTVKASCTVPKMKRGASLRAVKGGLRAAACTPGKVRRAYSEKVNRGKLIRLRKKPGEVLEPAAPIGIVLSKGPR